MNHPMVHLRGRDAQDALIQHTTDVELIGSFWRKALCMWLLFSWLNKIAVWWRRERLIDAVIDMLEQGVGVSEASWPQNTPCEVVLAWFDTHLAAQRTPYGIMGTKVVVCQHEQPCFEQWVTRNLPWWEQQRVAMAAHLPVLLARGPIVVGIIAVGTATHAVLTQQGR